MIRQKKPHNKVRTGCEECKRRRVKCDEERPRCRRCQKWSRECSYSPPNVWLFEPVTGNSEDRRALSFFREKTAPMFGGDQKFGQMYFCDFVPQVASSDLAVWHLAVAIGSRHEQNHKLADKHFSAGLWILSRSLTQMPVEVSLLSCQLLGCHANIVGEPASVAARHLIRGLHILKDTPSQSHVNSMFADLELCFALYCPPKAGTQVLCPFNEQKPEVAFSDPWTARTKFYEILRWRFYASTFLDRPKLIQQTFEMFAQWRQILFELGKTDRRALKMLFEYRVFEMCSDKAVQNYESRVETIFVDLSYQKAIDVICSINTTGMKPDWEPLVVLPGQDDSPGMWPRARFTGSDGEKKVIRVSIEKEAWNVDTAKPQKCLMPPEHNEQS